VLSADRSDVTELFELGGFAERRCTRLSALSAIAFASREVSTGMESALILYRAEGNVTHPEHVAAEPLPSAASPSGKKEGASVREASPAA
jgi:hypothetical protein